jgi:hypothetical protein
MPTVPNWIAKAVIFTPNRRLDGGTVQPIAGWRATKTQVIVTAGGRERRFYLDSLTEVGQPKDFVQLRTRLLPPDAPEVAEARRVQVIAAASAAVVAEVDRQRFQDTHTDAGAMMSKLDAVRDVVTKAIASLAEVL